MFNDQIEYIYPAAPTIENVKAIATPKYAQTLGSEQLNICDQFYTGI